MALENEYFQSKGDYSYYPVMPVQVDTQSNQNNFVFDYRYLLFIFRKKWWVIAATTLIACFFAVIYTYLLVTPMYASKTSVYVYRKGTSSTSMQSDLTVGAQLVKDSAYIVKSERVAQTAIQNLDMANKPTVAQLLNKITVSTVSDVRVITITVKDANPVNAAAYANAVATAFTNEFDSIINSNDYYRTDFVSVIDEAKASTAPVSPNNPLNISIGILLGFIIGIAIVFASELMDDTLKTPEKAKIATGLDVIGVVSFFGDNI